MKNKDDRLGDNARTRHPLLLSNDQLSIEVIDRWTDGDRARRSASWPCRTARRRSIGELLDRSWRSRISAVRGADEQQTDGVLRTLFEERARASAAAATVAETPDVKPSPMIVKRSQSRSQQSLKRQKSTGIGRRRHLGPEEALMIIKSVSLKI